MTFDNGTTLYQTILGSTIKDGYDARGHAHRRIAGSVAGPFDVSFIYDAAERLIMVEDPDPASNTNPKARRTLKQFTFATDNAPASCNDTTAGACDARNGKLLTGVRHNYLPATGDVTVTDTWQYRGLGGRSSQRDTTVGSGTGFSGGSFRASQVWNDLGLVGVLNYPARCTGGNCSMPDQRSVTQSYANGFLTGVTNFASSITYQPNGLIDTVTHANTVKESWIPDPNGLTRPCAIFSYGSGVTLASGTGGSYPACGHSLTGGSGSAVKWGSGAYAFDFSGNVKAVGGKGYSYDGVSRFTASNNGESVAYDVYGNITNHTGLPGNVDSGTNRLTTATYDDAGNVTSLTSDTSAQSASWDALSMMQGFRIFSKGPHALPGHALRDASYVYDPDDERIAVIDAPSGDLVASLRSVTTYTLRGFDPQLLREYTDDLRPLDNPEPPNSEQWSLKEDEIWRGSQLLALVTGDGYTVHYTLDHLGSPATLTDAGGLASTVSFDPFGTGGINFGALQFTGHERDQGAGLDYMHARYYTASLGRFFSVDPVRGKTRLPQSQNRYAYVSNNPLNYIDALGLVPCTVTYRGVTFPSDCITVTARDPLLEFNWFGSQIMNGFHFAYLEGRASEPKKPRKPSTFTKEQCKEVDTLVARERLLGTNLTAGFSGNTFGRRNTIQGFNVDYGARGNAELPGGTQFDMDWFTEIRSFTRVGALEAYIAGKMTWHAMGGTKGWPFQDPGEVTAVYYATKGATYAEIQAEACQ